MKVCLAEDNHQYGTPDGTGPYGRGMGPGNGRHDGSGLINRFGNDDTIPNPASLTFQDPDALQKGKIALYIMVAVLLLAYMPRLMRGK